MVLITKLMLMAWTMRQHSNATLHDSEINQQEILEDGVNQQVCLVYAQGMGQIPKDALCLMK